MSDFVFVGCCENVNQDVLTSKASSTCTDADCCRHVVDIDVADLDRVGSPSADRPSSISASIQTVNIVAYKHRS